MYELEVEVGADQEHWFRVVLGRRMSDRGSSVSVQLASFPNETRVEAQTSVDSQPQKQLPAVPTSPVSCLASDRSESWV